MRQFKDKFERQKDISYNKAWLWKNENAVTNRDFFEALVQQRIKEGFIFVNNSDTTSDCCDSQQRYVFMKILKAHKKKKTVTKGNNGGVSRGS